MPTLKKYVPKSEAELHFGFLGKVESSVSELLLHLKLRMLRMNQLPVSLESGRMVNKDRR